jgi:ribonuclease HII
MARFALTRQDSKVSASTLKMRMLKKLHCGLRYERQAWAAGAKLVAGVDEVGRGSLFGPVVAAAVILNPADLLRGLRDSKLLPQKRREVLAARIGKRALACSIAAVDAETIDRINIYQASRLAMLMAVQQLAIAPDHLLIDALKLDHDCPQTSIIHGDALSVSIAAASIIAKVERDRMMSDFDLVYPGYGLVSHKGYSTPKHIASLRERGPSPLHRQSFAPVWNSNGAIPQEVLQFALESDEDMANSAASEIAALTDA